VTLPVAEGSAERSGLIARAPLAGHPVITEVEQVAILLEDGSYAREIQWVIIRNEGRDTIDLAGWNLTSEEGVPFVSGGLDLVRGSYELPLGYTAIIVTSPYVELDRGEPVRHRYVFTAIDESIRVNESTMDFADIRLEDDQRAIVDRNTPECLGGCCCDDRPETNCSGPGRCRSICHSECYDAGSACGGPGGTCAKWSPPECGPNCQFDCCP